MHGFKLCRNFLFDFKNGAQCIPISPRSRQRETIFIGSTTTACRLSDKSETTIPVVTSRLHSLTLIVGVSDSTTMSAPTPE